MVNRDSRAYFNWKKVKGIYMIKFYKLIKFEILKILNNFILYNTALLFIEFNVIGKY